MSDNGATPPLEEKPQTSTLVTVVGFVLYAAAGLPILFAGLIMPWYGVAFLGVLWVIGLVLAIRWRDRTLVFLALPFVMVGLWFLTAWAGETFLGWTA
jgi:hypothetical protein